MTEIRDSVPSQYRKMFTRAATKSRPVAAIRAACLECCGYSANEVIACTAPKCPLYPYRMGGWKKTARKVPTNAVESSRQGTQTVGTAVDAPESRHGAAT